MFNLPTFHAVTASSEVPNNGYISNIVIEINPTITFANGYSFLVTFPPEIILKSDT